MVHIVIFLKRIVGKTFIAGDCHIIRRKGRKDQIALVKKTIRSSGGPFLSMGVVVMRSPRYMFFALSAFILLVITGQSALVLAAFENGEHRTFPDVCPGTENVVITETSDASPFSRSALTGADQPAVYPGARPSVERNAGGSPSVGEGGEWVDIGPLPDIPSDHSAPWVDATPFLKERGMVPSTPMVNAPATRAGRDDVDDQRNFWAINFQNSRWTQISATCRAVTDHCFVYVQTGASYNQDKVNFIADEFNRTIYPKDTAVFGPEPDVDGVEQIFIFIYSMDGAGRTGGYFTAINEVNNPNDPWFPYSNRCEMFYIDLGDYGSWGQHIAAHEFQHVIHYAGDANEDTWLDEGCADLAILKCYGWVGAVSGHVNSFRNHPDKDLTDWNQQIYDYGASVCFLDYIEEHYGGDDFIRDLVDENANSITGINNVLRRHGHSDTFVDIFKNWTVANKLDDPSVAGGMYNYQNVSIRIPNTASYNNTHYPINNVNRNVHHWAADYYGFKDGIGMLEFSFNGHNSHEFALMAIKKGPGGTEVEELKPDSDQDGDFGILGLGPTYDEIIIVVLCINSGSGTVSYRFSADTSNKPVIRHEPIEDNNDINGPHNISAVVVDPDYNLNVSSLKMYYNKNGSSTYTEVGLDNVQGDQYAARIPGPSNNVTIYYYLSASDDNNVTTHPFEADPFDNSSVHSFLVVPDTTPPEISHEPLTDTVFTGPYEMIADVVDDWFLDRNSVSLHYNSSFAPGWQTRAMAKTGRGDEFRTMLPVMQRGEIVNYYFTARDSYMVPNEARAPGAGHHSFRVLIPATVLLVDDDQAGNHTDFDMYYRDALNYTGMDYHVYRVPYLGNGPNATILNEYEVVIWETGDEWGNYISNPEAGTTLTYSDRDNLVLYLSQGGNLLLSGGFIGLELRYDSLFTAYYQIIYENAYNYTGPTPVDGEPGERISEDMNFTLVNRSSDSPRRYMCNYSVLNDASEVILTSLNGTCNVGYKIETEVYRALYFSFPFEEISEHGSRDRLLARALEFLHNTIKIEHVPLRNTVDVNTPLEVSMGVESRGPVETATLIYTTDGVTTDAVPLTYSVDTGLYSGVMPGQPGGTEIHYYVTAQNGFICRGFHPEDLSLLDPESWHNFTVFSHDDEPPEIVHQGKYDVLYRDGSYTFFASASDNIGLNYSSFAVEYAFSGEPEHMNVRSSHLEEAAPGIFSTSFEAPPGRLFYRIGISDIVGNRMTEPLEDFDELNLFYHDNFEEGLDNWSITGSGDLWELSPWNFTSFPELLLSGANFPDTRFLSTGANSNYTVGTDGRALSPEIDLTRAISPELTFYMWANLTPFNKSGPLDDEFDELILEGYDKTGYTTLFVYNRTTIPMENTWLRHRVDLSPLEGRVVKLSWRLVDRDETAQGRGVAIDFVKVSGEFNNTAPCLVSASCRPGSGFNGTSFTFNVTYSDLDNDWPENVLLLMDNGTDMFEMYPLEGWDDQLQDGKNYTVIVNASLGRHDHFFRARNLYDTVSSGVTAGPEVIPPNYPPVLNLSDLEVTVGHELSVNISASDPDGDALAFEVNTTIIEVEPDTGSFRWTPAAGDEGIYPIRIDVSDGFYTISGKFTITVRPNLPPVVTDPGEMVASMGETVNITIEARDPDNDTLSFYSKNALFTLNGEDRKASFVPQRKHVGDHDIKVSVSDGFNPLVNITFRLTVLLVNNAPRLLNASVTPREGDDKTRFTFAVAYLDIDGDVPGYVRLFIDGQPHNMTDTDDELLFYPGAVVFLVRIKLDAGNHSFNFECRDSSGADNSLYGTESMYLLVTSSAPMGPGKQDDEEDFLSANLNWILMGAFILILGVVVLLLVVGARRRRRREKQGEKNSTLSPVTRCPVCKTEVGKYETVCPRCDFRLKTRENIYHKEKEKDRSGTVNCPNCYSSISPRDTSCPHCKTMLGSPGRMVSQDVIPEADMFMAEKDIRYKKPPRRAMKKVRQTRKRRIKNSPARVFGEPDVEMLVFKSPDDYDGKGEGDEGDRKRDEDDRKGDDYFERELAKILKESAFEEEVKIIEEYTGSDVGETLEWSGVDGSGEDVGKDTGEDADDVDGELSDWTVESEDSEWNESMRGVDEDETVFAVEDEGEGGDEGGDEDEGYSESRVSADEHVGEKTISSDRDEVLHPLEVLEGKDAEDEKTFQWIDGDDEDDRDYEDDEDDYAGDLQEMDASSYNSEDESIDAEYFASVWDDGKSEDDDQSCWDDNDDEYETGDSFVAMKDDDYEGKTYVDAEFEVVDGYGDVGSDIAQWDDDEAESYFEAVEEVKEDGKKSLGRTRRTRRSRRRTKER